MKNRKRAIIYFSAAFFLPVFAMLAIYAFIDIYPFGSHSILTIDLNNQYISYFSYLKEILRGNHSYVYSFSKTLGGDMVGLSSYYLMSPLNLLMLLFPISMLPTAVQVITLVKLGLCGITFFMCVSEKKYSWHSWIFSTAYALMAYNIVYQQNLMWIDEMALLPLMVLGIRRIFQKKSPFLYLGALFFAIVLNYYIGFMLCIFSVLFFLYCFFFEDGREHFWDFKVIFNYVFASALSGGLGMWLVLPALKSLAGGKASFDLSLLSMQANFHWSDFMVKFFPGSFDYEQVKTGLPNVFCGSMAVCFLALFFMDSKVSFRKRAGAFGLFLILFLTFYFHGANLVWHGFNQPVWFPYRYSFIFSFLMLLFAEEGFCSARLCTIKEFAGKSFFILALFLFAAFLLYGKAFPFMAKEKYLLGIVVMFAALLLYFIYFYRNAVFGCFRIGLKRKLPVASMSVPMEKSMAAALLLLCILELCANGVYSLGSFHYADYGSYREFVETTEPAIDYVKQLDHGFYRMEKTFCRKQCDPMLFQYNGLSHYSSTEKNAVKYFMGQTGFRNNGNWSYYNRGSTYAMDSLLDVKYVLSKKLLGSPYQLLDTINGISIYENPYTLPLGFLADEKMLSCSIDNPHKFELQNEIWNSLYGKVQKPLFGEEKIEGKKLKNLQKLDGDGFSYVKKDESKKAYIEYVFTADSSHPVFAWFGTNDMHSVKVKVNGESIGKYFDAYNYDIIRLGFFEKGETVKVKLLLEDAAVNITDVWFYHQDMDVLSEYYAGLSAGFIDIETFSDTKVISSVSNQSNQKYALFTIPWEESWKAYIDGKETETSVGLGIFLAVEAPAGTHQIELCYIPAGFKTGLAITIVSLAFTGGWAAYRLARKRR